MRPKLPAVKVSRLPPDSGDIAGRPPRPPGQDGRPGPPDM